MKFPTKRYNVIYRTLYLKDFHNISLYNIEQHPVRSDFRASESVKYISITTSIVCPSLMKLGPVIS